MVDPNPVSPASREELGLSRDDLIALVMRETTDEIVADGWNKLGRPNVLVQGCRFVRGDGQRGYEDPEAAALGFAGFIADAILAHPALKASEARERELRGALTPFAKVADHLTSSAYGPAWGFNNAIIEHEDFRRARSALAASLPLDGEGNGSSRTESGGSPAQEPAKTDGLCKSDWADLIAAEFAKPQFMTSSAVGGHYSITFRFSGEGARERCHALEDAFRAAGRAINGPAQ